MNEKNLKNIIIKQNKTLGIKNVKEVEFTRLSTGENNVNILLTSEKSKYVIRIPKSSPENIKREFEFTRQISKAYAPQPIILDTSKNIFPENYAIYTFVEGKKMIKYTTKHLLLHAQKLSSLHKKQYPTFDKTYFGNPPIKGKKFDFYHKIFKVYLNNTEKIWPNIFNDPDIIKIKNNIDKYIKNQNYLFLDLKQFSLIHGDMNKTNILFQKNDVKYVDWEWAGFGDNAEDVAQLFDTKYEFAPWKIKISEKKLEEFILEYLKNKKDKTIRERIKVWMYYKNFIELIYLKWVVANYDQTNKVLSKAKYNYYIQEKTLILKNQFCK